MVLGHHVFINIIDHLNAHAPVSQAEIVAHLMYLRYDEINKCVLDTYDRPDATYWVCL